MTDPHAPAEPLAARLTTLWPPDPALRPAAGRAGDRPPDGERRIRRRTPR
ncbi:hypothetical protein ACWEQG_26545 [Microbispora sp. NPDC004025]